MTSYRMEDGTVVKTENASAKYEEASDFDGHVTGLLPPTIRRAEQGCDDMSKTERCQDCAGFSPSLNLNGAPTGFGSCTRGRKATNLKGSVRRSCGVFAPHEKRKVTVMQGDNFILTKLGGGLGYTLTDTDMWGLECALQHGLQDGYFKDNRAWAEEMLNKIIRLREPGERKT